MYLLHKFFKCKLYTLTCPCTVTEGHNIKNLRGINKLKVLKPNTTCYGNNSVKYLAAITWNKISDTLRSLTTLSAFRI